MPRPGRAGQKKCGVDWLRPSDVANGKAAGLPAPATERGISTWVLGRGTEEARRSLLKPDGRE